MRSNFPAGTLYFLFLSLTLGAQSVSRTNLELESLGTLETSGGIPIIATAGHAGGRFVPAPSIRLNGSGYFSIPDTIRFFHTDENEREIGYVYFEGASAELPNFLDSPLTWVFYTGRYDDLGSDTLMRKELNDGIDYPRFGSSALASLFSSHGELRGTGFGIQSVPGNGPAVLALYGSWNGAAWNEAEERNDAQVSFVTDTVRFNAFGGMRIRLISSDTKLRAGFTASLGDTGGNEVFVQLGLLDFTPGTGLERKAYLIFEPRIHAEHADFAMGFFSSPLYSDTEATDASYEGTYIGTNLLIAVGSLELDRVRGGLSISGAFDPENPGSVSPLTFSLNPFISFAISDYVLDTSISINPLRLADPATAGEIRVSLKAVY